jgi:hypothetical protein
MLCNQGIGESSASAFGENLCAHRSGTLPKTRLDLVWRKTNQTGSHLRREFGVAQKFGKNDRKYRQMAVLQRRFQ